MSFYIYAAWPCHCDRFSQDELQRVNCMAMSERLKMLDMSETEQHIYINGWLTEPEADLGLAS